MVSSQLTPPSYPRSDFSSASKMKLLNVSFCIFCILFSINVELVHSEILPGKKLPIVEASPRNLPSMLSAGLQPAVDSLLANEPNCSRWIWGTCYFNHGLCGEGKQHATRSGDGCRIIGITSRCFKECDMKSAHPYPPSNVESQWGVDEDDKSKKGDKGDAFLDFDKDWAREDIPELPRYGNSAFYAEKMFLGDGSDQDGEHCRWYRAEWGPCENGVKTRERKLRKNRGEKEGRTCPSIKMDTKSCGAKPMEEIPNKDPVPRLDATCKWNHEAKKCDKCEKSRTSCVMPLLSGNPATCGEERKLTIDC